MDSTDFESNGFAVIPNVLGPNAISWLHDQFKDVSHGDATKRRGESYFGIRDILNVVPAVLQLADSACIRSLVEPLVGHRAKVVRGLFFDKTPDANWKVAWHQDLTITVREKKDVSGFDGWSRKAGIAHVQPPASILEQILAVRLHLDDTDESNGALKVIPGSHNYGRLSSEAMNQLKERVPAVNCPVARGGAFVMRPLLLHASSASANPSHRRVIHLEFSSVELPGGLQWHGS